MLGACGGEHPALREHTQPQLCRAVPCCAVLCGVCTVTSAARRSPCAPEHPHLPRGVTAPPGSSGTRWWGRAGPGAPSSGPSTAQRGPAAASVCWALSQRQSRGGSAPAPPGPLYKAAVREVAVALPWPEVRTRWCRACVRMRGMSERVACTVQTGVSSQQINRKARIYASGGAKPLHFNYKTCVHIHSLVPRVPIVRREKPALQGHGEAGAGDGSGGTRFMLAGRRRTP